MITPEVAALIQTLLDRAASNERNAAAQDAQRDIVGAAESRARAGAYRNAADDVRRWVNDRP